MLASEDWVEKIYEAGMSPAMWPDLLHTMAAVVGAKGGLVIALGDEDSKWVASRGIARIVDRYFSEGWFDRSARETLLTPRHHPRFVTDLNVFTAEELADIEVYRDFLIPSGLGWSTGTRIPLATGQSFVVGFERAWADGPFERHAVAFLDALRPHFARAFLFATRVSVERARAAVEAMKVVGLPTAVLGPTHGVLAANSLFEALMPRVARDDATRFAVQDQTADMLLREALARLGANQAKPSASTIMIPAQSAHEATILDLVPIHRSADDVFGAASAFVLVTPVSPAPPPALRLLKDVFHLTPAEARIARGIGAGQTMTDVASLLGMREDAARKHVKAAFAKTGTRRQVELVRLLDAAGRVDRRTLIDPAKL